MTIDAIEAANRLLVGSHPPGEVAPLSLRTLTVGDGDAQLRGGLRLHASPLDGVTPAEWVIVAGLGASSPGELSSRLDRSDVTAAARWIRDALGGGSQVAASCTGVFLLGEAGALEGRRCTTTWWLGGVLGRRYPGAVLDTDELVVGDGPVWTAGASFAQADLILQLLEVMCGPVVAASVASRLLIGRRLSQAPYRQRGSYDDSDPAVAAVESFATANFDRPLTLAELARAAAVSQRTLARRFDVAVGMSPVRYVQRLRVEAALALIQIGDLTLDEIAHRVGFADASTVSKSIKRVTGQNPSAFRRPARRRAVGPIQSVIVPVRT